MSRMLEPNKILRLDTPNYKSLRLTQREITELLQIDSATIHRFYETLPFSSHDVTAGCESELQALVKGKKEDVDLPISIVESNYYSNVLRRVSSGDTSRRAITNIDDFLDSNRQGIWENSWVRFPERVLSPSALEVFDRDLLFNKKDPSKGYRSDAYKFIFKHRGEDFIRVPASYVLKLGLVDVISEIPNCHRLIKEIGNSIIDNFLCDNSSPETHSFFLSYSDKSKTVGERLALETAIRFLLTELLTLWVNKKFELEQLGQKLMVFFSPLPPLRLRSLNDCISDSFYRELFMNPCLSGWDEGELKLSYMHLCHEVLSRSQINAVQKLREAGIITNNLVVLPTFSNISLANNGTHITLGSRKLTQLLSEGNTGFGIAHEKYIGDLVIKILEHFIPLYVGTYSAAPFRIDFQDFHPERTLGFLPHELDFTHLRMFWRRWKKKAKIGFLGRPFTPFGIGWLDKAIAILLCLKGDIVLDFRLIDYFVCPLSTQKSPALNGELGNGDRLKKDLEELGIFNTKMSLYLLFKLREYAVMGFSGFEARQYSLFNEFGTDMKEATDLQHLLLALAYKWIAEGRVTHSDIPDNPVIESERRQVVFGRAAGIPTFYIHKDSQNRFLKMILTKTKNIRPSRRYPGYLRVISTEYLKALVSIIEEERDLIEALNAQKTVSSLKARTEDFEEFGAANRLIKNICEFGNIKSPFKIKAHEFNSLTETYYRDKLRIEHIKEAFQLLKDDVIRLEQNYTIIRPHVSILRFILGDISPTSFLESIENSVLNETIDIRTLKQLILLVVAYIGIKINETAKAISSNVELDHDTPVYRTRN